MISQDTKDQIEKEALIEYPLVYGKYTHEGDYMTTGFDVNAYNRANFIRFSTKYAEKLEEKDKTIESKDREIEQLKAQIEQIKKDVYNATPPRDRFQDY